VTVRLTQLLDSKAEALGFAEPHQRGQTRVAAEQRDLHAQALVGTNPTDERNRGIQGHRWISPHDTGWRFSA
jgi:hypothetical protein